MSFFSKFFEDKSSQKKQTQNTNLKLLKSQVKGRKPLKEFLASIKCQGNKTSTWSSVCIHKGCDESSIICGNSKCSCRGRHKLCFKESAETFLNKAITKSKLKVRNQWLDSFRMELAKINTQIQEIHARIRLCFLDKNESNFIFLLKSGDNFKVSKLTGNQMFRVNSELQKQISKEGLNEKVKKMWKNLSLEKIEEMISSSLKIVQSLNEKRHWVEQNNSEPIEVRREGQIEFRSLIDTKVLATVEQCQNLLGMFSNFEKKPIGFQLLFRASDFSFDARNNKQKYCGVAHTVVLVKTDKGKVIGGYTPLKWKILSGWAAFKGYELQNDFSAQSFIFSLWNNHKLILQSPNKNPAIKHCNFLGPIFCGGVGVNNKSQIENKSLALYENHLTYEHSEYKANDRESRFELCGSFEGQFHTQEWEVHRVIFEN